MSRITPRSSNMKRVSTRIALSDQISHVSLVVQGRFRISALDRHGNPFLERFLTRGDQFGADCGSLRRAADR